MKKKQQPTTNYDYFITLDTSRYKGEWIAISQNKIVAHGKDAEKVYKTAFKKSRSKTISLAKAPQEQMIVLSFFP